MVLIPTCVVLSGLGCVLPLFWSFSVYWQGDTCAHWQLTERCQHGFQSKTNAFSITLGAATRMFGGSHDACCDITCRDFPCPAGQSLRKFSYTRLGSDASTCCQGDRQSYISLISIAVTAIVSILSCTRHADDTKKPKKTEVEAEIKRKETRKGFLSLRFNDARLKQCARNLQKDLQRMGHEVFLCAPGAGDEFGPKIRKALYEMDYMVCFVTTDPPYAQDSGCIYTTFYELTYAIERKKKIIPLKLFKGQWPDTLVESLETEENGTAAHLVDYAFMPTVAYEAVEDWREQVSYIRSDPISKKVAQRIVTSTT